MVAISEFNLLLFYFVITTLPFSVFIKFAIFSKALFSYHHSLVPFYVLGHEEWTYSYFYK